MKTYPPEDIRNFAIVGHASCGKTMLSEAMLMCGGIVNRMGTIAAGSTASDYHPSEHERQSSIHASLLHLEWLGKKFNIVDTPGYLDFISEGLGALRVADFALVVVHASHGVGVGTEQVWQYASQYDIPKIIAINGLDKENADFNQIFDQLKKVFGAKLFPMNLPVNPGSGFNQTLDVLRTEIVAYKTDQSGRYAEEPAAGAWAEQARNLHKELVEHIAESDDSIMEKFFEQEGLSEAELRAGVHLAVQKQVFIPVFCLSAETNVGVARLMDFIAKYGASPLDRKNIPALDSSGTQTEIRLTDAELALYVFKTVNEPQFGDVSLFRLYSGKISVGQDLYNSNRRVSERIGQIYLLNGRTRSAVESLSAGDIGAVVKLKDTHTGDTLSSPKRVVALPKVVYPKPNIHAALRVKAKGDEDKLATALAALHEEDPTFLYHVDSELHQTVISAQGELHLGVVFDEIKRRYKIDAELLPPKIPYRETVKGRGESKYRHKKQTGGAGQFAEVWMRIEPNPRDTGVEFTESLTGQNVDRVFVPSVEKGVKTACGEGILAGYRVVDVKIDFYDGKMHPVDSKDIAFQIAGYHGFKEAFMSARPCLLEPIYTVQIKIPEDCVGKVMGDLSSRRGRIVGVEADSAFQVIRAQVPARELYHYSSTLRSLTGGRGIHTEEMDHYEEVPRDLEQKIIQEAKEAKNKKNE